MAYFIGHGIAAVEGMLTQVQFDTEFHFVVESETMPVTEGVNYNLADELNYNLLFDNKDVLKKIVDFNNKKIEKTKKAESEKMAASNDARAKHDNSCSSGSCSSSTSSSSNNTSSSSKSSNKSESDELTVKKLFNTDKPNMYALQLQTPASVEKTSVINVRIGNITLFTKISDVTERNSNKYILIEVKESIQSAWKGEGTVKTHADTFKIVNIYK